MRRSYLLPIALAAIALPLGAATVSSSSSHTSAGPPPGKLNDKTVRHPRKAVAPPDAPPPQGQPPAPQP